jgi:hypothetical protein
VVSWSRWERWPFEALSHCDLGYSGCLTRYALGRYSKKSASGMRWKLESPVQGSLWMSDVFLV